VDERTRRKEEKRKKGLREKRRKIRRIMLKTDFSDYTDISIFQSRFFFFFFFFFLSR
jgi:hypothetical protein